MKKIGTCVFFVIAFILLGCKDTPINNSETNVLYAFTNETLPINYGTLTYSVVTNSKFTVHYDIVPDNLQKFVDTRGAYAFYKQINIVTKGTYRVFIETEESNATVQIIFKYNNIEVDSYGRVTDNKTFNGRIEIN